MLGYIDIEHEGRTHRATLADSGQWECPTRPLLKAELNHRFAVTNYGPADGAKGARQLNAAAEHYGTTPFITRRPVGKPDTVY